MNAERATQVTHSPFHFLSLMWNHVPLCGSTILILTSVFSFLCPCLDLPVSRAEHCRWVSSPSFLPLPRGPCCSSTAHMGGHSHPFFFVSDDRFRFCVPPFSLRIEGERFRRIHSIGKIVHTTPSFLGHPNTHVCARPRLQPRLPSIRNGHESHHACHVHAHEVLGTSSRHQERKGADRMGDDLPHWTRKRTT